MQTTASPNRPPPNRLAVEKTFEENLERFQIYSRLEIGYILRGILVSKQLLQLNFPDSLEMAVSRVLDVDLNTSTLVVDRPSEPSQAALALNSKALNFEGNLDRIRISFTTGPASPETFDGQAALRLPFPERLARFQRRNHFRVPVIGGRIRIPVVDGSTMWYSTGNVRDLSSSGASVIDAGKTLNTTVGTIYRNCTLELPQTQPLLVSLEVRNHHRLVASDNTTHYRIGCQFVELSAAEEALIQRYITRIERQRIGMRHFEAEVEVPHSDPPKSDSES